MWIDSLFSGKEAKNTDENLSDEQKVWLETLNRWERVVKLKPNDIEARIKLIETNKQLARHEKAKDILNQLINDRPDHHLVKILIARRETEVGDPDTAIKYWTEISEADSTNMEPLVQIASLQFKLDRLEEAKPLIDSVLESKPNNLRATMLKAKYHQKIKQYELAIQCWNTVLEKKKNYYEAVQQIINCHISLEEYNAALDKADAAILAYPNEIGPKISKCKIMVGLQQWDDALAYVDEHITAHINVTEFSLEKVRILFSMERFAEAEKLCSEILDNDPDNIRVLTLYARIGQKRISENIAA